MILSIQMTRNGQSLMFQIRNYVQDKALTMYSKIVIQITQNTGSEPSWSWIVLGLDLVFQQTYIVKYIDKLDNGRL